MRLEEFRRLAETWGADIDRWPADARGEARKIAATDEGGTILEIERELDFVASAPPQVSRKRAQRAAHAVILQLTAETKRQRPTEWLSRISTWLVPSASLACSVMLGVAIAMSSPYGDSEMGQNVILSSLFDSGSMAGGLVLR